LVRFSRYCEPCLLTPTRKAAGPLKKKIAPYPFLEKAGSKGSRSRAEDLLNRGHFPSSSFWFRFRFWFRFSGCPPVTREPELIRSARDVSGVRCGFLEKITESLRDCPFCLVLKLAATVTGEIIDMACYFDNGASGPGHAECARMCIASGLPVGLKTKDGTVYLLIGKQEPANPRPAAMHESLNGQLAS
jgi:hypothetical protein